MGSSITFYAVKLEALDIAPKAVKKFLEDFFKEGEIFGITCLVAAECGCKSPWAAMDDDEYTEGLSEAEQNDCGVFTWLRNHPEVVFHYRWS